MHNREVIYFVKTTPFFFNKWEYYQVDKNILEMTYSNVLISLSLIKTIILVIRRPNADIFCWWWHKSTPIIILAWLLGRKTYCTGAIHMFDSSKSPDYYKKSFIYRLLNNISFNFCKTNLFISKDQFISITSHIKVNNPKVLYSCLSLKQTKYPLKKNQVTAYIKKDEINLLFLAWLTEDQIYRKSLLESLAAISNCIYKYKLKIGLTIAGGEGNALELIKNEIKRLKIENFITIKLNIENNVKESLYLKSDLLISPSHMEGFGNASLEAMAFGCPSIVSRYGASPEVVGETGIVLNFINTREITNAIFNYSKLSLKSRKKMREEAFQRAYKKFSFNERLNSFKDMMN